MAEHGQSMIERVVHVLEAFKVAGGSLSASEVARLTSIPVPSAHRIVNHLVELGMLERDSDRRVRIGMRLWEIVARSSGVFALREIALPYMGDLRAVVEAPTLLSVLDHNNVLNVCTLTSRQPSATNVTQPGVRLPVLASSPGMVLVAFAPAAVRQHILETAKVTRFTERTVIERQELARIAHDTRRVGHAIVRGWIAPDSTGVSVPVLAEDGAALAALSVTVPSHGGNTASLLPALHTTARGISRAYLAVRGNADPRLTLLMRQIRHATEIA